MAIRTPAFLRPTTRPDSAASAQAATATSVPSPSPMEPSFSNGERTSRPLNKIAMGLLRATPASSPSRTASPTPLVQDGTYLEALSLKLSEAVTKALAQPNGVPAPGEVLSGRRPIPVGRGTALGALIASELNAAAGNSNLRRAVIRALQRPMSVLRTNISTILLPLISSPTFLNPAVPTVQMPNPNVMQLHALSYATFAGELVEAFSDMGLGTEYDTRDNNLRAVRDDLVSMVGRVVGPLVGAMKTELGPLIESLEQTPNGSNTPVNKGPKQSVHPSILSLQTIVPVYAKALGRYASTPTAQAQVASLLISLAWRGLIALSAREASTLSPPSTPKSIALALDKKKPRQLSSTSPPPTPPMGRFMLKLPGPPSRPPSPPTANGTASKVTVAGDAKALLELLNLFPRPAAEKETTKLAREAVDEAFDALGGLIILLESVQAASRTGKDAEAASICDQVHEDLPTLIALPVLLRAFVYNDPMAPTNNEGTPFKGLADLFGMKEEAYRAGFLHGFGRAEEYAPAVGTRALDIFASPAWREVMKAPNAQAVMDWLSQRVEDSDLEDERAH